MNDVKALIAEARHQLMEQERLYGPIRAGHWAHMAHRLADALEAASVERAVVEAQALEQAADDMERSWRYGLVGSGFAWLRARAVEIREGRQ